MHPEHPIYLDNNATTKCDPDVVQAMLPYFSEWYGNAATGLHIQGREAARAIDVAREQAAIFVGSQPHEIVFTSGATESNNLAILGLGRKAVGGRRYRIVTTSVEHKAVLKPCHVLESLGYEVVVLPVDLNGYVDLIAAETAINDRTLLVSVQAANNELGTLQPVVHMASLAHDMGALIHCDAAQAAGKIPIDVQTWDVDFLSVSGHKIYGPKGIGALYVRHGPRAIPLEPLIYGGGQEGRLRSGTSNVSGIVGLGAAARLCTSQLHEESRRIGEMRIVLEAQLRAAFPNAWVNGTQVARLPNTISLTIPGIEADAILLNMPDVLMGVGSACSTGAMEPSHVLQAIGLSRADASSTIRLSLGRFNQPVEIPRIVEQLVQAVRFQEQGVTT